ncbi:MAG: carboxylesterase family protein [Flavobacteriales bacterium]|nr:carboxylesterase family protein [Flavobacteriales bacterium]
MMRMIPSTFLAASLIPVMLSAQECGTGRYTTANYFTEIDSIPGVIFGSNTAVGGGNQTLRMDIYAPANDVLELRPVVLVAFGGSFVLGSRADVQPICSELARRGFVAVAMDYRVGFFFPTTNSTYKAVMRSVHDQRGCIRFLRKTVAEDGNPYNIDPDRIIAGGISAGAIGAVNLTYMDQPAEMPAPLAADSANFGGMEGTSGPLGYSSDVIACYSLSGAVGDTSWMQPGDQPLCAVHETGDIIVPCYTEEVNALGIPSGIVVSGGHDMHERMNNLGIPNCYLEYDTTGQHVGYLTYDPETSLGLTYNFLADIVCGNTPACQTSMPTGISQTTGIERPWLYPVPADRSVTVDAAQPENLRVLDASGRVVLRATLVAGKNLLDVSRLKNGLYVVVVDGEVPQRTSLVVSR